MDVCISFIHSFVFLARHVKSSTLRCIKVANGMYVDCGNTYFSMFWENGQNVYPVSISLIDIKYIFTCHQYNPIRGENASISIQCMYVFMYVCTYKCMYCMYVCAQRKITPTCEVSDAGCARALLADMMCQRIIPASYGQCEEKQRHRVSGH